MKNVDDNADISTQNEQKKKQLADNDNNTQLEILEKSLRHYEQNNFHMAECILIPIPYTQVLHR
jgi:hypothetical protein